MASVEMQQSSAGRPKGLTRQASERRRAEFYRLWLMGWSESEIAESYGVDRSSVCKHIHAVRHARSLMDRPGRERYRDLLQQAYDEAMLTQKEAWRAYFANKDKPEVQSSFLGKVQNGISLLTRFIPDLKALRMEDKIADVTENRRRSRS